MSTIHDQVELEAAIAEAELTDEEAERAKAIADEGVPIGDAIAAVLAEREAADTQENGGPPDAGPAGEPSQKQLQALERATDRHLAKIHEIMGPHVAGFEACRECGGIGLMPPGPRPRTHPWFKTCDTCDGFGQVLTGSAREGQTARDCPECKGRGYLEALNEQGLALAEAGPTQTPPAASDGTAPATVNLPAASAVESAPRFGTPSWMGDTSLGGS